MMAKLPVLRLGRDGDEPEDDGSGSDGGDSGDGTVTPGSGGSRGGGVEIPDIPVPGIFEGQLSCGCDEDEVFVAELGQSFKCPEPVQGFIEYSEAGKYNIKVGTIAPAYCSCPEGTNLDWKIFDNTCDPFTATYNNVCLGKKLSSKVMDQCTDYMKYYYPDSGGAEGYKNSFKDMGDAFDKDKGYYKCWDKGHCDQFLKDAKDGKLSPNDPGYQEKKAVCGTMGFTKWEDWPQ